MSRSSPVTATLSAEILVELSGVFQPGYPETGPTYDCGGEPAEGPDVEDIAVTGLTFMRQKFDRPSRKWTPNPIDLLAGVDLKSAAIRTLLDNIANALGEEAVEALVQDAAE